MINGSPPTLELAGKMAKLCRFREIEEETNAMHSCDGLFLYFAY